MKRRIVPIIIVILIFALTLTGCTSKNNTGDNTELEEAIKQKDGKIADLEKKVNDLESKINTQAETTQNNLLSRVIDVMEFIKAKDMNGLSLYVHPTKGLRFSPYFNINVQTDQVFTAQQVAGLVQNTQVYTWGNYDGSGEPISLDFNNYYNKFVYDQDFANPHLIGNNVAIGKGNIIDNMSQAYPNGHFIEFHFTGFDAQFQGIDWESLKIVFEDVGGVWYLVGIVHGQWTI